MKNHNNGKISLIILLLIIFMGILVSIIYNKKDLQIEGKIIEKKFKKDQNGNIIEINKIKKKNGSIWIFYKNINNNNAILILKED